MASSSNNSLFFPFLSLKEIKELVSQIQNTTVVVRDTTKRALEMDEVIETVKVQYADMAARSREEAEQWNQRKVRKRTMI